VKRAPVLVAQLVGLSLVTALAATGCSGDDGPSIVVYNAQHEQLLEEIAPKFTDETGIEVELRNGSDPELAAQLIQEGDASPADVFLTENSPAMSAVERAGLFAPLDESTVEPIAAQYRPESGLWTGFVARSTVLVYNTSMVDEADLPDSIMDLADPEYAGMISFSPTGADFQAIVAAVLDLEGEQATQEWLDGIKANGTVYDGNNVVLESVNAGESAIGIIYHYYWYRDQEEAGDNSDNTELYFFGNQDPGAFLSISGAGVLAAGDHPDDAQQFVAYLTSEEGQQALADSYALEYPLNPAVTLGAPVKPLAELQPPTVGISDLDGDKVVEMMTEAGFL
jgi:iron(III) transport system substrate-binding protein